MMKPKYAIVTTVLGLGLALTAPAAAHHMCNAGDLVCPENIGDYMEYHDAIFDALADMVMGNMEDGMSMDPSNDATIDPQSIDNVSAEPDPAHWTTGPEAVAEELQNGAMSGGSFLD